MEVSSYPKVAQTGVAQTGVVVGPEINCDPKQRKDEVAGEPK